MRKVLKIFIAGCIATVVLSSFSFFYSSAGIHIENKTGATDYVWRPYEHVATMTEGFAWLRMNNEGFNNETEYLGCDILFMGSSHMDDLHFATSKNAAVLTGQLTGLSTYNIGMSGHTIYRCVDNYNNAIDCYNPQGYVVIETSTVKLSVNSMEEVLDGRAAKIASYDNGLIYYLQLIPAFKPIYKQLTAWAENNNLKNEVGVSNSSISEGYRDSLVAFLRIVSEKSKENNITPIIVYHPAEKLEYNGSIKYKTDKVFFDVFSPVCDELDIVFVDMTSSFAEGYCADYKLAHGFLNSGIGVGHLNEYGHKLIAERLFHVITELEAR